MSQAPAKILELSPDQQVVFDQLSAWIKKPKSKLITLGGFAGCGKSTLISLLASEKACQQRIAFCALTGKAANVLRHKLEASGVNFTTHSCGTIHRLMYTPKVNPVTGAITGWKRRPFLDASIIILDEASMVPGDVFDDLKSYGLPILAVGDHGQLPPVRGNFSLMQDPQLRLEKIHRQAEDNPIIMLSKAVREAGQLRRDMADGNHVRFLGYDSAMEELSARFKDTDGRALFDIAVITYTNKTRCALNSRIRLIRHGHVPDGPKTGEQVICLRNALLPDDKERSIFNGMRGLITKVTPSKHTHFAEIELPDDGLDIKGDLSRHQFGRDKTFASLEEFHNYGLKPNSWHTCGLLFDYGYSLTVHKAQGSGFDDVILFYERPGMVQEPEFRRWLYSATTRSSNRLTIIGAPS